MNRRIALIGSMKHKNAMIDIYNRLTLRGHCVYLPYMGIIPEDADEDMIEKLHQDKMQESDFVVVVDKDGYIGKDTQVEIKWCENSGKRIIYASDFAMFDTLQSEEKSVVNDPMVPPARSKKYTIN